MRTAAHAELVLDENSEGEAVISYLSDLVQRAERQQAEQQRIVRHQTFLNLPRMVNEDLAVAKEEVTLLSLHCTAALSIHKSVTDSCIMGQALFPMSTAKS